MAPGLTACLRVHAIEPLSYANGPGPRSVLWVQGCSLGCRGCFNQATHDPSAGESMAVEEAAKRLTRHAGIEGVTISGGEPFQQALPLALLLEWV